MDKNAIKKYAVWARNELIARVTQKAEQYEITEKKTTPKESESINGRLLTNTEKNQRKALIEKIQVDGFKQVMEEVAYTWFNRFTALRFMEVNNYLPSHTRVFTNEVGEFKPQILADAIQMDLEGLNMDKVFELKDANKTEDLYKYLLITQCNALSAVLPRMFQKIEHYTELLLPDYLLREGSVIEQMIALIPEKDWTDQVQIIGWLYQYYNSEPKDSVFAALKKNVKISKENIPAATQLFTPDWIVRYMVENSLGRLWLEGHPNDRLKSEWKYYLDETEQEADVQKQLDVVRTEYANLKPEDIRCIDPCMGSGHILCYMFDVLVKIYEDYGYTAREAVENIVDKNLWGLDIDERAAQLSYFAVMMKARQYDRRFLTRGIQPHVYAIEESNGITSAPMHEMGIELSQEEYRKAVEEAMRLIEEMHDAKEYGSIIQITPCDWELLRRFAIPRGHDEGQIRMDIHGEVEASARLQVLINIGQALSQKYHAVITNPPYLSSGGMSAPLQDYVKANYKNSKSDLFAVFIERCKDFTHKNAFQAMITQHAWMFLTSFEQLRINILATNLLNMIHLGARAFDEIGGEVVQTTSFVLRNLKVERYKGVFCRLIEPTTQDGKEELFLKGDGRYFTENENFTYVPGAPIAYWAGHQFYNAYIKGKLIGDMVPVKKGLDTGNNDKFLRYWHEVSFDKIGIGFGSSKEFSLNKKKWAPHDKGGEFRRWYGNTDWVINWENDGFELHHSKANLRSEQLYFKKAITWGSLTTGKISFRYSDYGAISNTAGSSMYPQKDADYYIGYANSSVAQYALDIISPTLNYSAGPVSKMPINPSSIPNEEVSLLVRLCIKLARDDWDSYENSWNFAYHPLIPHEQMGDSKKCILLADCFSKWSSLCEGRFRKLKESEELLNNIFIKLYKMEGLVRATVDEKDVSIRKADLRRDVRSLLSYSVGCMFGRYSLDEPGLAFAGGQWNDNKYKTFIPDADGIIPICDDEYFLDDIVGRFVEFIEVVYGKETLESNLSFIADGLGYSKGSPKQIIRNYFMNDFYADHLKLYQKRPIYWLFDSGKKNGFKCLIYIHRYRPDMIARVRTDYLHEQQARYRTATADLEHRISRSIGSEKVQLTKKLNDIQDQIDEARLYEEKIHHLADMMIDLDLDNGVKANYDIFKDVLAKKQ